MKWRVLLICLLIANSLAGCEGVEKKKENPNVLFISIDTLRKDHLGIYGYDRPTSPQIDALAKSGIVFDNMISTSSWTLPAHASMLTGKYPAFHGLQDDGVKLAPSVPTIAEYYKKRGYHTMAVVSHVYVSSEFGLERGFDIFDDSLIEGGARNPIAEEVVDNFLYLADKMPAKKYFGFIHFFDPHDDYTAPPPFNAKFTNPAYTGDINGTIQSMLKYYFKEQEMPETDRQQLIGHYDEEIAYVDSQIGRLLKELKRRGMLDNTVIILTSDHGEEFKDHGQLGHGRTLFGEQLHVPLIIVGYPSVTPGSRNGDLVSSIDFYPTLVNLIGGSNSQHFQGRPIIDNEGINNRFVVAETIRYGFEIKSIRQGRFKLIYELNSGKHFYYDLKSDPFEMKPMHNDPTGGELRSALVDYTSFADSGWHLKLIALENSIQLNAVVETNGRFLQPRYYFTKNIGGALTDYSSFDLSQDRKTLTFNVSVINDLGEIIFKTEPPDAAVTFKITTTQSEKKSGVFLGKGMRIADGQPIQLLPSDPRVEGTPKNYSKAPSGLYIRAVKSIAESAPKTKLTDQALERLRSLGYIQ